MTLSNSVESISASADQTLRHPTGTLINCEDRWQVYHRLQELDISCKCSGYQPLEVEIKTATEAIQLWSIINRTSQPRQVLAASLTRNWQKPCGIPKA